MLPQAKKLQEGGIWRQTVRRLRDWRRRLLTTARLIGNGLYLEPGKVLTQADLKAFVDATHWQTARATRNPHQWTLKKWTDPDLFDAVVRHVRENGYVKWFWRKRYICLDIGPHRYWSMDEDVKDTVLLNRALNP
jgi:hypothetical protein